MAKSGHKQPFDIQVDGDYRFDDRRLFAVHDLVLRGGEWTCLLGTSGVGKSTLLRQIAGLDSGGRFRGTVAASDHLPLSGRIAYMAQSDLLLPWLTVRQNATLGSRLRGEAIDPQRLERLLAGVGLAGHGDKRPAALSGGMRQRTALLRTLFEDVPVVLLDEPFSALDTRTRLRMQSLAFELLQGKTVLLVTHDPAEALRMGHRLYELTASGLERHPLPPSPPVRAVDDAALVAAHTTLLRGLVA